MKMETNNFASRTFTIGIMLLRFLLITSTISTHFKPSRATSYSAQLPPPPNIIIMGPEIVVDVRPRDVITDLTIRFLSKTIPPSYTDNPLPEEGHIQWYAVFKDLYLRSGQHHIAWVHIACVKVVDLDPDDRVIYDIRVGGPPPSSPVNKDAEQEWESRPGGIWILRGPYSGETSPALTDVDVLFGSDAVDPRPGWTLLDSLSLPEDGPQVPSARLTVRRGWGVATSVPGYESHLRLLRARPDGRFKIVQIADTHMVTGPGVCNDAMDADGNSMEPIEADPRTVDFVGSVLDEEKPDLVILTGDQIHHGILDTQTALFKVVAPMITRGTPYAVVFGNHDDEGTYALTRETQMSILQTLPLHFSVPGPLGVDGVGNYYLQISAPSPHDETSTPSPTRATLYFLDSHGQIPSEVKDPGYDPISQTQIDWFTSTAKALRKSRLEAASSALADHSPNSSSITSPPHLSLAFFHIPLPEYANDANLIIRTGQRGEPTEGPSTNTQFYDALAREGVAAVGCGHDHVNDFCALVRPPQGGGEESVRGPWLCYGGGSGFGGYGSYGGKRFHRRARVWELDTSSGGLKTWKRVEYALEQRTDEVVLVRDGVIEVPSSMATPSS